MIYLVIFLLVAAAGIAWLWLQQWRERKHLHSVEGFRSSLERLSSNAPMVHGHVERAAMPDRGPRGRKRPEPLDPARRAAALRRLEQRRAARP